MRFDGARSIFLQIGDYLGEMILEGEYAEGERIPSIREMAARMEVNPNTVIRSYAQLQEEGVIYNQRGMGYFVAQGARERVLGARKEEFTGRVLPGIFRTMRILGIDIEELKEWYARYEDGQGEER
jgi:DNA-binding transcriptional regulator YhcF (GntR family)